MSATVDANGRGGVSASAAQATQSATLLPKIPLAMSAALGQLHKEICKLDSEGLFANPVTREEAGDVYFQVISHPMDLSSIATKINAVPHYGFGGYKKDFTLMCKNAMTFNEQGSGIYNEAKALLDQGLKTITAYKKAHDTAVKEHNAKCEEPTGVPLTSFINNLHGKEPEQTHLGLFCPVNKPRAYRRLADGLPKFTAVSSRPVVESSFVTPIPFTNIKQTPWQSFAPIVDGEVATVDHRESSWLLNHDLPWTTPAYPGLSAMDYAKAVCFRCDMLNTPEKELARTGEKVKELLTNNPRAKEIMQAPAPEAQVTNEPPPKYRANPTASESEILDMNDRLLAEICKQQKARVRSGAPWRLLPLEEQLASDLQHNLVQLAQRKQPRDTAHIGSVRKMLGIRVKEGSTSVSKRHPSRDGKPLAKRSSTTTTSESKPERTRANASHIEAEKLVDGDDASKDMTTVTAMVTCDWCHGLGPVDSFYARGIPTQICFGCAEHYRATRQIKPVLFGATEEPVAELANIAVTKQYVKATEELLRAQQAEGELDNGDLPSI
eukprot:m.83808 g.83808  ORF g.83808 m.83808 type:complete len:552 (-) comp12729_c0_seq2:1482-3137(-)